MMTAARAFKMDDMVSANGELATTIDAAAAKNNKIPAAASSRMKRCKAFFGMCVSAIAGELTHVSGNPYDRYSRI